MSNWILRAAEDWLRPVYDELHRKLVQRDVLHADERTLQVLQELGKSAQSKICACTGPAETPSIPQSFTGWLHADGYSGYHSKSDEAFKAVP